MNPQLAPWITKFLPLGCALVSLSSHALEPLSDQEMSDTTAQNGKAIEEEQVEQLLASSMLVVVSEAVKEVLPLDADIEVEGLELDGRAVEITDEGEIEIGINDILQASQITIDTLEFNNIRMTGAPETFGSAAVQGLQVDQSVHIQVR